MSPEQKERYLAAIREQIAAKEVSIADLEIARNRADGKMQSRYDTQKEELNTQVNISRDVLDRANRFREEIEAAEFRYSVESGAFLDLLINGEPKQFVFMNTSGTLPDISVVTPDSPIGQAIVGKIPGDTAQYSVGVKQFKVDIKSIL